MSPGCCEFCGTTDERSHWASCPKVPEVARAHEAASRIVAAMIARRARNRLKFISNLPWNARQPSDGTRWYQSPRGTHRRLGPLKVRRVHQ